MIVASASFASALCTNDTDCSDDMGVARCNVTSGACECLLGCFSLMSEMNDKCTLNECATLDDDNNCRDGKYSKTTAILLSVFLISFGAANFYIERYELAAVQLFLGLLLCCVQVRVVILAILCSKCVTHCANVLLISIIGYVKV